MKKKKNPNRKINRLLLLAAIPIAYKSSFSKLAGVLQQFKK